MNLDDFQETRLPKARRGAARLARTGAADA
jgi:hypothetical protein